jgi:hypothetical protein
MSLYSDVKYLNQIGHRIEGFQRKGEYLYQCRCPICGDSQTSKKKKRGYFYRQQNDLYYKCHNCDASQHFGTFLKNFDSNVYREYSLERYAAGENRRPHAAPEFKFDAPVFQPPPESDILERLCVRVDTLPESHEVREFCSLRKIPADQLHRLYYIDDIKKIESLHERYQNTIQTHEPRLVIPFRDSTGRLVGLSCRGLRGEALRYITVRVDETAPLIFGIDQLDKSQPVYVCEGPIDSLFLSNSIAVGGTGFGKLGSLGLDSSRTTIVIDNQPRNSEVVKITERIISAGWRTFVWPKYTTAKDINDLVIIGAQPKNIIDGHTYQGLTAQIKFNEWKKV